MISKELIIYSLRNLWHRKTRSFLTIFSILIGITTIFIFLSFGLGLYNYVDSFKTGSTADKITIMPASGGAPGLDDNFWLSEEDLEAIKKTSGVSEVSPMYFKIAEVQQGRAKRYVFIGGMDSGSDLMKEFYNIHIYEGRDLRSQDTGKAVLGYNYMIDKKIFTNSYELNDNIEVNGQKLRVVGFYESVGNPTDDSQVYVTLDEFERFYPNNTGKYSMIVASADINDIKGVVERVEKNLRDSRNLEKGKEDFFVSSFEDLLDTYTSALDYIVYFVMFIAFISVIVSAINTANTMITSVLERTREIGVIKSVGARNSDVFDIFLFESGFLGFIAGCLGVLIGFILSYATYSALLGFGWGFLKPFYSVYLFIGCILFATITGAASGVWPAYKSSKIRPVEALRYE